MWFLLQLINSKKLENTRPENEKFYFIDSVRKRKRPVINAESSIMGISQENEKEPSWKRKVSLRRFRKKWKWPVRKTKRAITEISGKKREKKCVLNTRKFSWGFFFVQITGFSGNCYYQYFLFFENIFFKSVPFCKHIFWLWNPY